MDVVNGCPTGAVRVSFGYMSTLTDAKTFIQFINDCFVDQQMLPLSSRPTEMSRKHINLYVCALTILSKSAKCHISKKSFIHFK